METVRIFYSWQSDREPDVSSRFIAIALRSAIEALQPKFSVQLQLDSDTSGVAGTPPVSETILGKIRDCDLFIGDVSFVGSTANGSKLLPNPNVMTEFGYARHVLDDQQIILVMNAAFGPASALPFDLAHLRHPISYVLEEGSKPATRRQTREAFAGKIAPYLEASIRFALSRRNERPIDAASLAPVEQMLDDLHNLTARGDVPAIVPGPRLVLRLAPMVAANSPYLEPARVKAVRHRFTPENYDAADGMVDNRQWASFDPPRRMGDRPNPEARWYVRLMKPGILEAIIMVGARIDDDRTIIVDGLPLEGRIVELTSRLSQVAVELGLDGVMLASAELQGLEDVQLFNGRNASRQLRVPNLHLGSVTLASADAVSGAALRLMLDNLWLGCGFDDGSPSFLTPDWQGEKDARQYAPATVGGRSWR
jgi:hypothetical protein